MSDIPDPVSPAYAAFLTGLETAMATVQAARADAEKAYIETVEQLRIEYENARAKERV